MHPPALKARLEAEVSAVETTIKNQPLIKNKTNQQIKSLNYSDIQLSVYSFSCLISVCPFVALLKVTYAENSRIVLSCRY